MIIIELFSRQKPTMRILDLVHQIKETLPKRWFNKNADLQNIARYLRIYRYKCLFSVPSMF